MMAPFYDAGWRRLTDATEDAAVPRRRRPQLDVDPGC
ncbi:hypothetical protein ABH921_000816 [Kocuria sp. MT07]